MQYKFNVTSLTSSFNESEKLEITISRDESQVAGSVGLLIKQVSSKAGFKSGFNRKPHFDFKAGQDKVVFKPGQILKVNPSKPIQVEMTLQNPEADMGTATVSSKSLVVTVVPAKKTSSTPTTPTTPTPKPTPTPTPTPSTPKPSTPVVTTSTAADIAKLEKLITQTQGSLNTMQSTLKSSLGEMQSGIKNIQVLEKQSIDLEQAQQEMMIEDNTEVTAEMSEINQTLNQLMEMISKQPGLNQQISGNTGVTGGLHTTTGGVGTQPSGQHTTSSTTGTGSMAGSGSMPTTMPTTVPGTATPAHVASCGQYTTYIPIIEYEIPSDLKICKREFDHACSLSGVTQKVVDGITRLTFPANVPPPPAPGQVGTTMPVPSTPTTPPSSGGPTAPAGTKQPSIPSYYGQIHIPGKPDPQWAYVPNVPIDGTLTTCPAPMKPEAVFDPYTNNVVQACVLRSMSTTPPPITTPTTSSWKPVTKYLNDWSGNVEYRFRNGDLELRGEATAPTASSKAKANPNSTAPIFWIMDADIMPMIPSMMKVADGGGTYSGVGLWWTVFSPAKDGVPQDMATGANGLVVSAHAASIALAPISFTGVSLPV